MKFVLFSTLYFLFHLNAFAQRVEFDGQYIVWFDRMGDFDSAVLVHETMSDENKNLLRELLKVSKLDFNKDTTSFYRVRGFNKFKNWELYEPYSGEPLFVEKVRKKYSFEFPTHDLALMGYCIGTLRNKSYLLNHEVNYSEPVGRDAVLNPNRNSEYYHKLLNLKGRWMLMNEPAYIGCEKFAGKYDFEAFPSISMEASDLAICKDTKGRFYLASLSDQVPVYPLAFDEIVQDSIHFDPNLPETQTSFYVRLGNLWGRLHYNKEFVALIHDVQYASIEQVPNALMDLYPSVYETIEYLRTKHNAIHFNPLDRDGFKLLFQDKNTKKFGMYFGEGNMAPQVPAIYDSIVADEHDKTYTVHLGKLQGVYSWELELCFQTKYLEIMPFELHGFRWVALRDEHGWYAAQYESCFIEVTKPHSSFESLLESLD